MTRNSTAEAREQLQTDHPDFLTITATLPTPSSTPWNGSCVSWIGLWIRWLTPWSDDAAGTEAQNYDIVMDVYDPGLLPLADYDRTWYSRLYLLTSTNTNSRPRIRM
jgi:hypothetical protein